MLLLKTGDGQLPADESVSARALEGEKIADRKRFSICVRQLILWGKTQISSVKRHDHKYCHTGFIQNTGWLNLAAFRREQKRQ